MQMKSNLWAMHLSLDKLSFLPLLLFITSEGGLRPWSAFIHRWSSFWLQLHLPNSLPSTNLALGGIFLAVLNSWLKLNILDWFPSALRLDTSYVATYCDSEKKNLCGLPFYLWMHQSMNLCQLFNIIPDASEETQLLWQQLFCFLRLMATFVCTRPPNLLFVSIMTLSMPEKRAFGAQFKHSHTHTLTQREMMGTSGMGN